MFEFHAGILARYIFAVPAERHVLVENIRADDNPARVRACLTGRILEFCGDVYDSLDFGRVVIHIDEFGNGEVNSIVLRALFRVIFAENFEDDIRAFQVELVAVGVLSHEFIRHRLGNSVRLGIRYF